MYRELRIALTLFLVYFIFGLYSYFSLGDFVTPFFFSKITTALLAFVFFIRNFKIKQSYFLGIAFVAFTGFMLMDDFSLYYIAERINSTQLIEAMYDIRFIYFSFILFFSFLLISIYLLLREVINKALIAILLALFLLTIIGIIWPESINWQWSLTTYYLIYFIITQRSKLEEKSLPNIISALFIFEALVDSLKYLYIWN